MTAEGDDWFACSLAGVRSATLVFNDNKGHQTPDLELNRDGWYDGTWHEAKPGRSTRRKVRKAEPA
jgi:hypothetical protein